MLPTAVPPHKQHRVLTAPEHRLAMLELAIGGNPAFAVSRYEIDRGGVNYTVDTLTHLGAEHPDAELFFLMGADMLADLPHWRNAPTVCQLALPIAVRRGRAEPDFDRLCTIAAAERVDEIRRNQVEMPPVAISGTEIRRRVAEGRSIRYQTPAAVEQYISAHRLYRPE
jgi:nicotinate-nucleotide adenylyltransferase